MQTKVSKTPTNLRVKNLINTKEKIQSSRLLLLFEDELKDIYWVEKALTKALPKMIKNATSEVLVAALKAHLIETYEHITRIEKVFEVLNKKAIAKKCIAMEGLIKEAESVIDSCTGGAMCDAGIIAAGQKIEHYEIAAYGTLRQFAKTLGLSDAAEILEKTLSDEKKADQKLSEIAIESVNMNATFVTEISRK